MPRFVAERGSVVALRSAARLVEQGAGPERDAEELPQRWVCLAVLAAALQRQLAFLDSRQRTAVDSARLVRDVEPEWSSGECAVRE